jgi:hypothetical protein
LLDSYFDESGTHGDAKSTVIAGYVGDEKAWAFVDARWRRILDTYCLKTFHLADAIAQRGEFAQVQSYMVRDICNAGRYSEYRRLARHLVWCGRVCVERRHQRRI